MTASWTLLTSLSSVSKTPFYHFGAGLGLGGKIMSKKDSDNANTQELRSPPNVSCHMSRR